MTPEEFARVEECFEELCAVDPPECVQALRRLAAEDPELASLVSAMLEEDLRGDAALERAALPAAPSLASLAPTSGSLPERIGPFRILSRLGSGGMGTVYLAQQEEPRRRVAVKVLHGWLADAGHARRFRREARLLARLKHAGIAQVYEWGLDGAGHGQAYLAMELVEGEMLTEYAEAHGLGIDGRVQLIAQICDAVQHAHQNGVIHRDLKPDNVLVVEGAGPEGGPLVKVLDFGVARTSDPGETLASFQTTEGQVLGTLAFMSPEQASAEPVDHRTDVYSLGAMLFQLLSGRLPRELDGRPLPEALREIQEGEATRLGHVDRGLGGDLDAITARALSHDPARRYPSAALLAEDLRRYLAHEPVLARAPSTAYRLRQFTRRNRTLVGGVVSTISVLAVGIVVATALAVRSGRNAEAASRGELQARRTTYRASLDAAKATLEEDPAAAHRHLEAAPEELRGWEWDWLASRLERTLQETPFAADAVLPPVQDVARSEDGAPLWAYAVREPDGVLVGEPHGAEPPRRLLTDGPVRALTLSPRGRRLAAVAGDEPRLHVWDLSTSGEEGREAPLDREPSSLVFAFDGSTLALGGADGGAMLVDAATLHVLHAGPVPDTAPVKSAGAPLVVPVPLGGGAILHGLPNHMDFLGGEGARPVGFQSIGHERGQLSDWVGHMGCLQSAAFELSPDGGQLARSCQKNALLLQELPGLGLEQVIEWWGAAPVDLSFSREGTLLAGAGPGGVGVWDVESGRRRVRMEHAAERVALEGAREDVLLATSKGVRLCSLAGGGSRVLEGLEREVLSLAFSPDGSLVAAAGRGEQLGIWDLGTGELLELHSIREGSEEWEHEIMGLSFDPTGTRVFLAQKSASDGWSYRFAVRQLGVAPAARLVEQHQLEGQQRGIFEWTHPFWTRALPGSGASRLKSFQGLVLSRSGRLFARADRALLEVRNVESGEVLHTLRTDPTAEPNYRRAAAVALHPDDRLLAWGLSDGTVALWDLATEAERHRVSLPGGEVLALDFSPDGTRLATAGADGLVRLLRVEDLSELLVMRGHTDAVKALRFSPDGSMLVSGSADSDLRVWDASSRGDRHRGVVQRAAEREAMGPRTQGLLDELGSAQAVVEHLRTTSTFDDVERSLAMGWLLRQER